MTSPLRVWQDYQNQKTADSITLKVVHRLDNGQYRCTKLTDQSPVIMSKANPNDEFLPGSIVTAIYLGGSGLAVGGGYIGVSRAPQDQKGLAGQVPSEDLEEHVSPTISATEPSPLELEQGGEARELNIYGTGFLLPFTSYGEGISRAAEVIGPTHAHVLLSADDDAALGSRDVMVGPLVTIKKVIQVIPVLPIPAFPRALFVSGNTLFGTQLSHLYQFNLDTLALQQTYDGAAGESVVGAGMVSSADNTRVYWISCAQNFGLTVITAINPNAQAVDPRLSISLLHANGGPTTLSLLHRPPAQARLMCPLGPPEPRGACHFALDGSGVAAFGGVGSSESIPQGLAEDNAFVYEFSPYPNEYVKSFDKTTLSPVAAIAVKATSLVPVREWTGPDGENFGLYTGRLVAVGSTFSEDAVVTFMDSDFTHTNAIMLSGEGGISYCLQLTNKLYTIDMISRNLYLIDPSGSGGVGSVTLVGTVGSSGFAYGLATDGVFLYTVLGDGFTAFTIVRVNPSDASVAASTLIPTSGNNSMSQVLVTR